MYINQLKLFFLSTIIIGAFCSAFAADTSLRRPLNDSGKLLFMISQDLPKGTYKIWNLTTNQQVGANISKIDDDEVFGKVVISEVSKNDKFAVLNSTGSAVFTLPGISNITVIDPISSNVKQEPEKLPAADVGTDQLSYVDKLIVAQKNQLASIEQLSRKSKIKIQKMMKKNFDCQKELESKIKLSPEIEIFCNSTKELAVAYQKAEDQLKTTSQIKIQTLESISSPESSAVSTATQIAAKNLELPTNLDPKSLQIPAQTTTNASMTPGATGSWGLAQRFYDVSEYSICMCGSAMAQVTGKTCPENSTQTGYYNDGPYYLNNVGTKCDLNSNPPVVKYATDDYTPSTLSSGAKAVHGKDVIAQARALRESGEINKLTGPEAMEFMVELNQVLAATGSFREGEPIKLEARAMGEIWAKYIKEQDVLQEKNREVKKNVPQKNYGDLNFKFLNFELNENKVPINTLAVVPITEPVSLVGGIAEVRLVGGFWGQHGWEVSTDKKNFSKIETPVEIKNGDVIYLRGQSVNKYNHGFGIEIVISAKKVNGADYGHTQFLHLSTENGCNNDTMISLDYNINIAPHTFSKGQNERCFALPQVYGGLEKGKTDIWEFRQGIVVQPPMKPLGSEVTIDCSEINRLVGKETLYKISPYTNPYNGKTQDYYPTRDCKISGKIKYTCTSKQGWIPAKDSGVCELY